ncbi:hypothetical protein TKK_0009694 [Trichogramma kaykai]|uniref:Dipeptidase n=1 Tax=Trichogramma kaykai TaxID=54128 RepID=A0ABD2X0R8_9HYME
MPALQCNQRTRGIILFSLVTIAVTIATVVAVTWDSIDCDRLARGSAALRSVPVFDGHNDLANTIYELANNNVSKFDFEKNTTDDPVWGIKACKECMTDYPRLVKGSVGAQFWSAYVSCKTQYKDAVPATLRQIDVIKRLVNKYKGLRLATSHKEVQDIWDANQIASFIGVEGGHSIDSSLAILRIYYDLGVRYMTLTHTCNTPWADASPALGKPVHNLTEFGKKVVLEMNRLGMVVDLSHVSHNVMRDALNVTKAPLMFSHSSVYAICNHHRNVPDDVLLQLKKNDGIIMINFNNDFVNCNKSRNATLEDVVEHINYVRKLIGVDHVGLGADFNGISEPPVGLEDVSKYPAIFDRLYKHREDELAWTKDDLEKLASRNMLRVLERVEKVSETESKTTPLEDVISVDELKFAQKQEGLTPGSCQTTQE